MAASMKPGIYQIQDGDALREMTLAEIRALVPAAVKDSTLRRRLQDCRNLAKLVRTVEQAKADQKAKRWRTNNRRGQ